MQKITSIVGKSGPVVEGVTPYYSKYFAHEITRLAPAWNLDRITQSLFNAYVDLSPHRTMSTASLVMELDVQKKDAIKQTHQATTLYDRPKFKNPGKPLLSKRKRAEEDVFNASDEIHKAMESFIESLEKQLEQSTLVETLFTIHWSVV